MVNVLVDITAQHQQVEQQQHEERYYVTVICDVALCHSDVTLPECVRQRDGFPFSLDQWVALGEFYGVYTYYNTPLKQELLLLRTFASNRNSRSLVENCFWMLYSKGYLPILCCD